MLSTIFCIVFIEGTWGTRILFKHYFTGEKQSKYMLKLLWTWIITAVAGAICYFICKMIKLDGIPAFIAYGIIATVTANIVYAAGSSILPEFKPAVNFALKLAGIKKAKKKNDL